MFKQFVGMAIISTFLWAIALGSFSIAPLQGRVIHRIWNRQKKHWSSEDTLIVSTHLDSAHIHHGFNVDCLTDGRACLSLAGSIISPHQSSTYISYLYVVDMDKDDDIDVVTTISHGVRNVGIEWHENLGDGSIWYTHTVSEICGLDQLVVTDIDNDGDYDIMSCKQRVGENFDIIWFEQIDDNWLEHKIIGNNTGAETIEAADIDLDGDPDWQWIDWTCSTPTGTSVSFQVRASDDYTNMGAWSDTLSYPSDLEGILIDDDSYFQYRTIMQTTEPAVTPVLNDVTISWDPVRIGETTEPIPPAIVLLPIAPNPSVGFPVITFGLPEQAYVGIYVFDLSGRLVSETHGSDYSSGYHDVQLPGKMFPGVYFCRMTSGDFTATQRFVVIE